MTRAWLRSERGEIGLTQLLVAMVISTVILGATLTTFEQFVVGNNQTNERNDAQQEARGAVDQLARHLRNLASPTENQPQAIDSAGPSDLVFKTVDPNGPNAGANATNVKRVRYCVSAGGTLWSQTQTWTTAAVPGPPAATPCGAQGGWTSQQELVRSLTNGARPLFTYNAATPADISSMHVEMYLDRDPGTRPLETTLSTGVFLRNQNRRPTASFTATPSGALGIVLNASASLDPEGQTLRYEWYVNGGSTPAGTGPRFTLPAAVGSTSTIKLVVSDPAALEAESTTTVTNGAAP